MQDLNVIIIPAESVFVGDRQRTSDSSTDRHIDELARDIEENGLIHAPSINKNNSLIAGWCRLQAIKKLNKAYMYASTEVAAGFVPVAVMHQDDERVLYRIELMENLRRKNLSPVDEAKAITKLHKMFTQLEGPTWSKADTGQAIDALRGVETRSESKRNEEVGDALILSSFENDADVNKAKSRSEAVKIAKKKLEQQLTTALGEFKPSVTDSFEVIQGDLRSAFPSLAPASFHGIVTDPPYGIEADSFGEQTMALGHEYKDTWPYARELCATIFAAGYQLCKDTAHLYMFCDLSHFYELVSIAKELSWKVYPTPLIWRKEGLGHAPQPGYFSRRYECILFAQKGDRKLSKSRSDVFDFAPVKNKIHAAQKPVELLKEFLNLSFFPGERILDPCCGSGSIFHAAKEVGLRATGIELDMNNYSICKNLISSL